MTNYQEERGDLDAGCYCDECIFWHLLEDQNGECRRHAPTVDGHPVALDSDWCGEGESSPDPPHLKNWPGECWGCIFYKGCNNGYGYCFAAAPDARFEFQKVRADRIACRHGVTI